MCSILNFLRFIHIIFVMLVFQVRYSFILVSCGTAADANVSCIPEERQALLDFKHALQDDYGRLSSWGTTQDCCSWSSVQCNSQTGHVEMLDLHDRQLGDQPLSGEISTPLMELQHLKYLDLRYNDFNGSHIPDFFGSLSKLIYLDLSYASFGGIIPYKLGNLSSLQELYLNNNYLAGSIPKDFGKTMNNLEKLVLSDNQLNGVVSEIHFDNLTKLQLLDLSFNSLTLKFSSSWVPSFQLQYLWLSHCKLGPSFPSWLQNQHNMRVLDISYAGISDSIPRWFWNLTTKAEYLEMSNNNFTGTILNQSLKFTNNAVISLFNNQFEGPIPLFLLSASWLDFRNNKFSKLPPTLCNCDENCDVDVESLGVLELSNNQISGQLPHCWGNFKSLEYLSLFNNKLSGKIPISLGSLFRMHVLILSNNELNGDFPPLKNCTSLKLIDLGGNQLSGSIPSWIWDNPSLDMLVLRKNKFNGSLPIHLCHAKSIQLLDLSFNLLSGGIPKCLNNFTAMAQEHQKHNDANEVSVYKNGSLVKLQFIYGLNPYLVWKGRETIYPNTRELLNTIDLSHNKLSGEIPTEIASLVGLVSLNLSTNNLSGEIISEIAELKLLEVLDLSRNRFSGRIPSSLSKMTLLNSLNVSYNNLSGEIPIGTQLQSFDSSSYEGNPYLCGKPLESARPSLSHEGQEEIEDDDEDLLLTQGFYLSMGLGFFIGFWGVFGSILFNRSCRRAYFNFLNNLTDNIYVTSMLNIARVRRWFKT